MQLLGTRAKLSRHRSLQTQGTGSLSRTAAGSCLESNTKVPKHLDVNFKYNKVVIKSCFPAFKAANTGKDWVNFDILKRHKYHRNLSCFLGWMINYTQIGTRIFTELWIISNTYPKKSQCSHISSKGKLLLLQLPEIHSNYMEPNKTYTESTICTLLRWLQGPSKG